MTFVSVDTSFESTARVQLRGLVYTRRQKARQQLLANIHKLAMILDHIQQLALHLQGAS